MKKGSLALRLFLYASLVSLVWLGGYVVLCEMFAVKEDASKVPEADVTPVVETPMTVASQWSVLAVADGEREVETFMFRYADFLADAMVFIEVPVNTKVELTKGGYEILNVHNPELPELFMVSDLCRIFSEETWCMAAEEAGVSLLGIRPKECYVIEKALYDRLTEQSEEGTRFVVHGELMDTVVTLSEQALTNDTLKDELVYLESYADMDRIIYRNLPGESSAEEYHPDFDEIQRLVEGLQAGVFEEEETGQ